LAHNWLNWLIIGSRLAHNWFIPEKNNANAICKHIVKVAQANRTKPNFAKELAKPTQDKIGLKISQRFKK